MNITAAIASNEATMRNPLSTLAMLTGLTAALVVVPTGDSAAAPPVAAQDRPKVERVNPPTVKIPAKIEAKATAAVPGETRNVEAKVTRGSNGIAGQTVSFEFAGTNPMNGKGIVIKLGAAQTNAEGKATFAWKVPELGQAAYTLKASAAGDDVGNLEDTANFGIIKGITKLDVRYSYSTVDSKDPTKIPQLMMSLKRQADGETLNKPITLTVNDNDPQRGGRVQTYPNGSGFVTAILQDWGTVNGNRVPVNQWKVKVVFEGDAANQATMFEQTFSK